MQKDPTKYVIDARYFRGSCITIMNDDTHCDYFGNTLEELREKENNPYLIALLIKPLVKRARIYMESFCGPFEEVSVERPASHPPQPEFLFHRSALPRGSP